MDHSDGSQPGEGMKDSESLVIEKLIERVTTLEDEVRHLKQTVTGAAAVGDGNKVCIVVFSGDLDKILAAMNIATGAASMGCEVNLFFTFLATPAMRKASSSGRKKTTIDKMFAAMLPAGADKLKLSTMHWAGLGTAMIKKRMKDKNAADLNTLLKMAEELDVKIFICEMSMDLMGMAMDDLREYPGMEQCGVGTFMGLALNSKVTLFI
jgi:peroxiredoxin family protein